MHSLLVSALLWYHQRLRQRCCKPFWWTAGFWTTLDCRFECDTPALAIPQANETMPLIYDNRRKLKFRPSKKEQWWALDELNESNFHWDWKIEIFQLLVPNYHWSLWFVFCVSNSLRLNRDRQGEAFCSKGTLDAPPARVYFWTSCQAKGTLFAVLVWGRVCVLAIFIKHGSTNLVIPPSKINFIVNLFSRRGKFGNFCPENANSWHFCCKI